LSITFVVGIVVYINTNTNTSVPTKAPSNTSVPTGTQAPTSAPTQVPTSVPRQVQPDNYTTLYEYLPSVKEVSGYKVTPSQNSPYAYSLLNTSPYNITKVGFNFESIWGQVNGTWLYKLDKDKVASPSTEWATIYASNANKLYIRNILIEPGESFVINMKQLWDKKATANFEIKFVEVLLPV
jgi:hypothetical protein